MLSHDRTYRVIDVNLNRASEGLRVLEDAVRFFINDRDLTEELKNLRHLLLKETERLPGKEKLIALRDSVQDVGAKLKEEKREKIEELIEANFKRVEEALRSLEEYGKLILSSWGEKFREFRFQTYNLEKKTKVRLRKKINLTLYAVTPSSLQEKDLLFKSFQLIRGGATAIQLREKSLSSREFLNRAIKLKKINPPEMTFIINDRIDIALACDAQGVHLGQDDVPLSFARKILGEDKIIGVSTHSVQEAKKAEAEGADYVAIGPVFSTPTKADALEPVGCELVSCVKREIKVPVVAIGGILLKNIREVLKTGVDGVAVISAIFSEKDVLRATQKLIEIIEEYKISE